jgi:hypothetical protein
MITFAQILMNIGLLLKKKRTKCVLFSSAHPTNKNIE